MEVENLTVPDVAEPFLGFRCWDYDSHRNLLLSVFGVYRVWPQGEPLRAVCTKYTNASTYSRYKLTRDIDELLVLFGAEGRFQHPEEAYEHKAPYEGCGDINRPGCGIYCAFQMETVAEYSHMPRVYGLAFGWGKVIPGRNGFRAELAYPAAIFDLFDTDKYDPNVESMHTFERSDLYRVARAYNVPVIVPDSTHLDDYREGVRSGVWKNLVEP